MYLSNGRFHSFHGGGQMRSEVGQKVLGGAVVEIKRYLCRQRFLVFVEQLEENLATHGLWVLQEDVALTHVDVSGFLKC